MSAAERHKHYAQQILSSETCQGDWEMEKVWGMPDLDLKLRTKRSQQFNIGT